MRPVPLPKGDRRERPARSAGARRTALAASPASPAISAAVAMPSTGTGSKMAR